MPPQAQVIIFDDSLEWREVVVRSLNREGHQIIGQAGSIQELEEILPSLVLDPRAPIVALIDNNAPWKPDEWPDERGVGHAAERRIIEFAESIGRFPITVSMTSSEDPQYGEYHYPVDSEKNIGSFVTALPRKER